MLSAFSERNHKAREAKDMDPGRNDELGTIIYPVQATQKRLASFVGDRLFNA